MKTVILAGGLGSRLQEETTTRPKPMVEIGGRPILWHIMKHYAAHGFREFVIALGYKGDIIKDYFLRYRERSSNLSIHLGTGDTTLAATHTEDWLIHLVDTGERTQTAGRLHRLSAHLAGEPFLLTYGDGVADVDIPDT
ncbi:MAG: sugar phosphate nucleotidyltransferase, partial [Bryobacteraceae bacterium]